jgi:hypothetical protein
MFSKYGCDNCSHCDANCSRTKYKTNSTIIVIFIYFYSLIYWFFYSYFIFIISHNPFLMFNKKNSLHIHKWLKNSTDNCGIWNCWYDAASIWYDAMLMQCQCSTIVAIICDFDLHHNHSSTQLQCRLHLQYCGRIRQCSQQFGTMNMVLIVCVSIIEIRKMLFSNNFFM